MSNNSNIVFKRELPTPDELKKEIPISEKIETTFTSCKSFVENEDFKEAICEVEKTIFLVNHLSDKYSFNLDNIF